MTMTSLRDWFAMRQLDLEQHRTAEASAMKKYNEATREEQARFYEVAAERDELDTERQEFESTLQECLGSLA